MSGSTSDGLKPPVPARTFQPTFAAGELAPVLRNRSDLAKWRAGAQRLLNFVVLPQGAVSRRSGTQFIETGKDPAAQQRLIPFQFSTEQQYVIEMGAFYLRFIYQGAYLVTAAGQPYEVATPYRVADLLAIRFVQSADVLTLVNVLYQPMELRRYADLDWRLVPVSVGSQLAAPGGVTVTPLDDKPVPGSPAPDVLSFTYAVAAASNVTHDQGPLSDPVTTQNISLGYYLQYGVRNRIAYGATPGATFYIIFRQYQGVWAQVGSTADLTFDDINYTPDTGNGPAQGTDPFVGNNFPGTVGYFQERRVFGGMGLNPQTIIASKSGAYTNFDVHNPVVDDDAITYTLAARQENQIRHLIPLADLLVMTGGGGWKVDGSAPVTPSNFHAQPQSFVGAANVEPIVVGNRILFVEAKGSSIREIAYQFYANTYVSEDKSVFAKHLFAGHSIVAWAYADTPDKVVWAVRDDGALLSMTYLQEQDVYAWAQHLTPNGQFRSVAVVSETIDGVTEDVTYFVVARTVQNRAVSMIERMSTRLLGHGDNDVRLAWHVDSGLRYVGPPVGHVSGLDHLEGQAVGYLADGLPGTGVVQGGVLGLPVAASIVVAGLAFVSEIDMLPADSPQPMVEPLIGRLKHLTRARIALVNAAGLRVSVDGLDVTDVSDPDQGTPVGMVTGTLDSRTAEGWTRDGVLSITCSTALPATVLGVACEWEVGE